MEQMKKIVEMFNTGNVSEVNEILSSEYIDHQNDSIRSLESQFDGPEEFQNIVRGARKSLPNLSVLIEDIFERDNKVATRLHWHSEANGKIIDRETIDILQIENGL